MVGLTFLDLGAENGASSAPPALQEFFVRRGSFSLDRRIFLRVCSAARIFYNAFKKRVTRPNHNFDDLLLYGQKAIFRKKIISVHRKIVRNEVVLMNLSYIFLKNVTPSIFALPHSKMTKTPNFHAS
jgi:hypothetical protein